MARKRLRIGAAAAACAGLVLGSSAMANAQPPPRAVKHGGNVTIVLLKHYNSFEAQYDKYLAAAFEKTHPGVTVKLVFQPPSDDLTKFDTMASAGSPPNVFLMPDVYAAQLMSEGVLSPVNYKALGVSGFKQFSANYIPNLLGTYQYHGALYGVPEELSDYMAWVNKAMYAKAGLPVPTTWNQVCADGPKLTVKQGGAVTSEELALPINFPAAEVLVVDAIARVYGAPLFNLAGNKSYLTSKPVEAAMTMLQNLVYKCHAFYPAMNGTTTAAERTIFAEGHAAMLLDAGSWFTPELQTGQYSKNWKSDTVTPYPTVPGRQPVADTYSYAYVVPKAAPNQAIDWEYVKFLQQAGAYAFKNVGLYSGLKSLSGPSSPAPVPYWKTQWLPSQESGFPMVSLIHGSEIDQIFGNAYDSILLDHASVASTLQSANSQITPLLNR